MAWFLGGFVWGEVGIANSNLPRDFFARAAGHEGTSEELMGDLIAASRCDLVDTVQLITTYCEQKSGCERVSNCTFPPDMGQ